MRQPATTGLVLFAFAALLLIASPSAHAGVELQAQAMAQSSSSLHTEGGLEVQVISDRTEALPGDVVAFMMNVRNTSSQPLAGLTLESTFPQNTVTVEDPAGGQVSDGRITWPNGSLQPGEMKSLSFSLRLNGNLQPGADVNVAVSLRQADGDSALTAQSSVNLRIISGVPKTGAEDFFSPLENTRRFLTPFRDRSAPGLPWAAVAGGFAFLLAAGAGARRVFRR